jgi:hypothetical protein
MPVRPGRPGWVRRTYYPIRRKAAGRGWVSDQGGLLTVGIGLLTDSKLAGAVHLLEDLCQHESFLGG